MTVKWKITFEGDYYEDQEEQKDLINFREYKSKILECEEKIRSRLKWDENVGDKEDEFLRKLLEVLNIED